jgi:serine phosphatase RsbU (regulator of sigma subunit)
MPAEEFLSAANAYLLRQRWDEGFATAVHLGLDLVTGRFRLASAGHPPAAHYHAGSGVWEVIRTAHGPVLGIIDGVEYPAHEGRLDRGDALLLYTDGLVETPGRDLDLGIDRLMGQAEKLVRRGQFRGGADWIVDGTRTDESDDRALVLLWRE